MIWLLWFCSDFELGVRNFRIKSLYKPPTLRKVKDNVGLVHKKPRPLPRLEEYFPELLKSQSNKPGAKEKK